MSQGIAKLPFMWVACELKENSLFIKHMDVAWNQNVDWSYDNDLYIFLKYDEITISRYTH